MVFGETCHKMVCFERNCYRRHSFQKSGWDYGSPQGETDFRMHCIFQSWALSRLVRFIGSERKNLSEKGVFPEKSGSFISGCHKPVLSFELAGVDSFRGFA